MELPIGSHVPAGPFRQGFFLPRPGGRRASGSLRGPATSFPCSAVLCRSMLRGLSVSCRWLIRTCFVPVLL